MKKYLGGNAVGAFFIVAIFRCDVGEGHAFRAGAAGVYFFLRLQAFSEREERERERKRQMLFVTRKEKEVRKKLIHRKDQDKTQKKREKYDGKREKNTGRQQHSN
jgi:hypothetical protein